MKKLLFVIISSAVLTTAVAPSISAAATPNYAPKTVVVSQNTLPITVYYQNTHVSINSLPTTVLKKLLVNGFRYGGELLGNIMKIVSKDAANWIKKNSAKVADFLDELTAWQTEPIKLGLVALGLPPADALVIAEWIVLFIGI